MSKAGELHENPITGEQVVVRVGTEESGGKLSISDLYVSPGGAVAAEHVHSNIEETFTVVGGSGGFQLDEREDVAEPGRRLVAPPGIAHYWWNAGDEEAHVVVELRGDANLLEGFEKMISTLFGIARDGKTDAKGRSNLLQAALFAQEFDGVIRFVERPIAGGVRHRRAHGLASGQLPAQHLGYPFGFPDPGCRFRGAFREALGGRAAPAPHARARGDGDRLAVRRGTALLPQHPVHVHRPTLLYGRGAHATRCSYTASRSRRHGRSGAHPQRRCYRKTHKTDTTSRRQYEPFGASPRSPHRARACARHRSRTGDGFLLQYAGLRRNRLWSRPQPARDGVPGQPGTEG